MILLSLYTPPSLPTAESCHSMRCCNAFGVWVFEGKCNNNSTKKCGEATKESGYTMGGGEPFSLQLHHFTPLFPPHLCRQRVAQ